MRDWCGLKAEVRFRREGTRSNTGLGWDGGRGMLEGMLLKPPNLLAATGTRTLQPTRLSSLTLSVATGLARVVSIPVERHLAHQLLARRKCRTIPAIT